MHLWKRLFLPLGVLLPLAAYGQQHPGHRGPLDEPPGTITRGATSHGATPKVLGCDHTFSVSGYASEQVESCDHYNFGTLYRRAESLARALAESIRCDSECAPVYTFVAGWDTDCTGSFAHADVTVAALCPKKKAKPRQLDPPTARQLSEPMSVERWGYAGRGEVSVDATSTGPLACPGTSYIRWRHIEHTSCLGNFDYTDVISKAETESQYYYDSVTCPAGCRKTSTWNPVYTSWDCRMLFGDSELAIDIYMKVECQPQ